LTNKENKLKEILSDISKPKISLKELGDYYLKAKEVLGTEATVKEFTLAFHIFEKGSL